MALKTWIDEIEAATGAETSGAVLSPEKEPDRNSLTPDKEDHPEYTENHVHAIIILAVREIERNQKGRQYHLTEELRTCENEVNSRAKAILAGESSDFEALRKACTQWVEAARKAAAPQNTAELFSEVKV